MVLHCGLNNAEIENYANIGPQPGMGATDAELERLALRIHEAHDDETRPWSSDVSGFDWSVPLWALEMELDMRMELVEANELYWRCCEARMYCESKSLFILPNGLLIEQLDPGMVKSGSYLTASRNSHIRGMLAILRAHIFGGGPEEHVAHAYTPFADGTNDLRYLPLTMGDDCVEVTAHCTQDTESDDFTLDGIVIDAEVLEWQYQCMGFKTTFDHERREFTVVEGREPSGIRVFPGDLVSTEPRPDGRWDVTYKVDVYTFCGYKFWSAPTGYAYEPDRWQKQLCTLLNSGPLSQADADERLAGLRFNLRHSPHRQRALEIVAASGWGRF